jgi:hypothetical protein
MLRGLLPCPTTQSEVLLRETATDMLLSNRDIGTAFCTYPRSISP